MSEHIGIGREDPPLTGYPSVRYIPVTIWERTYGSELSGCSVTVGILGDGRIEVTIESSDGDTSWGERLDRDASKEVTAALMGLGIQD